MLILVLNTFTKNNQQSGTYVQEIHLIRSGETSVLGETMKNSIVLPEMQLEKATQENRDELARVLATATLPPETNNKTEKTIPKALTDSDLELTADNLESFVTNSSYANKGKAVILKGLKSATIYNESVLPESQIFITFNSDYYPGTRYWVEEKIPNISFTIKVDKNLEKDAEFEWLIVK